jgi:DNA-binding SARP family transcriptional activator/tetratricopeptide (TPR) repeat protein
VVLVEFHILGPVGMYADGHAIDAGHVKVRGLLGVLLLKANKVVDADVLADALWDDKRPPVPRNTLQVYASRLRRMLKKAGDPATVITEYGGYRLQVDPEKVDYHRFLAHVRAGHAASGQSDHARAAECFEAAVALWRRPPLSSLMTSWAQHQRETLTTMELVPALSALFQAKLELGEHEFVLSRLHPLLGEHSHDEMLARQWMRALAASHRSAEIHSFFKDFTRRLTAELGAEPSDGLTGLYRSLTTRRESPGPAPPPAARVIGNWDLPADPPSFTGREALLAHLDKVSGVSVVTVDGPPGVGKTALVSRWARTHANRFPDGVLYANLQGYAVGTPTDPAIIMKVFLTALGTPATHVPDSTEERAAALRHLLTDRKLLVILDNVLDARHVRPMLPAVSPCQVIITSRQQLTSLAYHHGAERITVPLFSDDEAQALLRKRIGDRPVAALAELAELCDRLPLALRIVSEHVAARSSVPVSDLVADLRQSSRLLDAGQLGDDLTDSLRSVISWSYRALPPTEARLLRLLGLHPIPQFSSHAAAAVTGFSHEVTDQALDTLIGAHLVQQERADRYSMHDIVHAVVADLADEPAAVTRMADWYLRSLSNARMFLIPDNHPVPELPSGANTTPMTFTSENQALRWCMAERPALVAMTHLAAHNGLDEHVWRLAGCLGELLDRSGDIHEQVEIHRAGWDAALRLGDQRATAGCLNNLGKSFIRLHDYDRAEQVLGLALPIFEEINDVLGAAVCRHNLGTVYLERGDPHRAIESYRHALTQCIEIHDDWSEAYVHHRLGDCYRSFDNAAEADKSYQLALALRIKLGDQRGRGITLASLGQLHLEQGNTAAAIDFCRASLDIHRQTADHGGTANALCTLASALVQQSPHQAVAHAHAAVAIYRDLHDPHEHTHALTILANAYEKAGELDNARDTWLLAHKNLDTLGDPRAADVERHVQNLRQAISGIPDPRPDEAEIPATQEKP